MQINANWRNKILKFGAALSFKRGDLTVGYVTNISKAGCFIQVGHNTTMRAGLNELSDAADYDFVAGMPIGRVVVARITKTEADNTRFNCSLRRSLVVYGVHQVNRNELKPQAQVTALILALSADGVAFGQLKGSYHKMKIKNVPDSTTLGSLCQVDLTKVTKEKIVGDFKQFVDQADSEEAEKEQHYASIYQSVQEEAIKDILLAKKHASKMADAEKVEADIEEMVKNRREQTQLEEQIADLQQLDVVENDSEGEDQEDSDAVMDEDDSDAEDMRRINAQQKVNEYEDSDENAEEEDEEDDDEEEGEEEDEEMSSDNEEESKVDKRKSGKNALKKQLQMEAEIREKEAQMRSSEGAQP